MRTARFVTAFSLLLLSAGFAAHADEALDREITLVGRDETLLPVPQPAVPQAIPIPELDLRRPATPIVPPVASPADSRTDTSIDWVIIDHSGESPF